MQPTTVSPVAEAEEDQYDVKQELHLPARSAGDRAHDSPCDPYLNFDGMARESMEFHPPQSPATTGAGPRSMRSSRSLTTSLAESFETNATSFPPSLQTKGAADDGTLEPLQEDEDEMDPRSFDLVAPVRQEKGTYSLEKRCEMLFSKKHMGAIFKKPHLLGQFSQFLATTRPASLPLLTYYLETEKALRAIRYANAVVGSLKKVDGHDFSGAAASETVNKTLQAKHDAAFEALARDELPMFITHVWIEIVSLSIRLRIIGSMPSHLREASEGLAEVFCLTDPSRRDNPIILASDEFHRTTQYGMNYAIGRNCRFLQGPGTNPFSVKRIRDRIAAGKEHYETFLNYRRDGSPFLNLLLCAPLIDSRGQVRYFLGAQVDVSGLAKECAGLDGLKEVIEEDDEEDFVDNPDAKASANNDHRPTKSSAECCRELSEMFDRTEIDAVRRHGGHMHSKSNDSEETSTLADIADAHPYVVIEDGASPQPSPAEFTPTLERQMGQPSISRSPENSSSNGRLAGVYENYLLIRPSSKMQVLFASPSLRVPGMLQSPFLSRIGGSGRVRSCIAQAFREGRGVTAKARWLSSPRHSASQNDRGRLRWLHCTPLKGINNTIGIWMVVIVDEEQQADRNSRTSQAAHAKNIQKQRVAPPIDDTQIRSTRTSYIEPDGGTSAQSDGRGYTVRTTTRGPWTGP